MLSLTSLPVSEFEDLVPTFKSHWDDYYSHYTLKGKVRERISCGRRTGKLPQIEDKLLFNCPVRKTIRTAVALI
ncbi:MAG: hypothetical protein LBP85_10365 [Prevotellaceae bacterium]|nr:hypothetical protein [Prevotellaceae bacterium]